MLLLSVPFSSFNALPSNSAPLICFYSFSQCPCQFYWINDVILVCLNVYFFLSCPWHRILFPKLIHPENHFSLPSYLPSRPTAKWQLQMAKQMLKMQKLFEVSAESNSAISKWAPKLPMQAQEDPDNPKYDYKKREGRWLVLLCWTELSHLLKAGVCLKKNTMLLMTQLS